MNAGFFCWGKAPRLEYTHVHLPFQIKSPLTRFSPTNIKSRPTACGSFLLVPRRLMAILSHRTPTAAELHEPGCRVATPNVVQKDEGPRRLNGTIRQDPRPALPRCRERNSKAAPWIVLPSHHRPHFSSAHGKEHASPSSSSRMGTQSLLARAVSTHPHADQPHHHHHHGYDDSRAT